MGGAWALLGDKAGDWTMRRQFSPPLLSMDQSVRTVRRPQSQVTISTRKDAMRRV